MTGTRASLHALLLLAASASAAADPVTDLAGLWESRRAFGPEVPGTLTLTRHPETWEAEIAGFSVEFAARDAALAFALPGERGEFQGEIEAGGRRIRGHWIQPPTVSAGGRYASPLLLEAAGENVWRGEVVPLEDEFTFYLVARARADGSLGAFLRNPNRNLGFFLDLDRLERSDEAVRLVGRYLGNGEEKALAEGAYHPDEERLSVYLPNRGGTYDFTRVRDDPASSFYARGQAPAPYRYQPPPAQEDGWAVGTLEEVGISVEPIRELIETVIEPPAASMHDLYVHGLLIARHGKLVLEEYFHGFYRDKPHDTRSASKSLTSVLVGAAIQDGAPLAASSPVYETVYGTDLPADLDPRKRRMTVEHLLTMSSGLDCDDGDPASPGNEEVMTQEQIEDLDWARYTLNLPMAREPGTLPFYCSASPNLVGRVLSRATGEPLPALFQRLVAEPLQIRRYHLNLTPTGEPYMGGGIYWLPRDFMKLGQLLLDGGVWNGRRVVSEEWAARSVASLVEMREMGYGYLWWVKDYPYRDRTVRAFYAGGNGGQLVIGVPELDLLVTFYGGNYQDRVQHRLRDELVPRYILPAVDGGG